MRRRHRRVEDQIPRHPSLRIAAEAELLDALKGPEQTSGYAPVDTDVPVFWDSLETRMRNGGGVALTGVPAWRTSIR
ncbi:hypothetical protein ACFVT1_03855 [Streptomyces sp. NPDC057963]|uniref:hypothetical protein n=1 Tax=Streptomyces sp. NPDC057963 TaxID=3346290 RepID=UPI0036E55683